MVRTPNTTASTSTVTAGHDSASTPNTTLASPTVARTNRSSPPPNRAEKTFAAPPATNAIPTAIVNAITVIAGHSATRTPATIQPRPTIRESHGRTVDSAEATSATPLTTNAAAISHTRTLSESNGLTVSQAPSRTHASPRASTSHHGRRREISALTAGSRRSLPASRLPIAAW